jgi:integrase
VNSGSVDVRVLGDGSRAFRLRFNAYGRRRLVSLHERTGCDCGCGGGWDELAARRELADVVGRVRVGEWKQADLVRPRRMIVAGTSFEEYARGWLKAKEDGVLGELRAGTKADYRWCVERHLIPLLAGRAVQEIDRTLCLRVKAGLLGDARELRAAIDAGQGPRDERGRARRPLGPASIRKILRVLAAILDEAVEDELIASNPARGKRMQIRVPKPERTFLEMDELALLLDTAAEQDAPPRPGRPPPGAGAPAMLVGQLYWLGYRPAQIASRLGLARSTVSFHLRRLEVGKAGPYAGRCVTVEILARTGVRVSELCDLKIGEMRLRARGGARFHIVDAKTDAGVREVQMTPELVDAVRAHLRRLAAAGLPTGPNAYLVPNTTGGRMDRGRVAKILAEARKQADDRQAKLGLPPLPHVTPHTLRRTYVSIALVANNFDVKWVMSQVGHADSKMTLDIYAQLEQRAKRTHGESFDQLIRQAREPPNDPQDS